MKWAAALILAAQSAIAEEASDAFVEANILGIFYHELGHAVIDIEHVPIFAQEEDAADTFSILLIDALYEPDAAEQLAYDAALGFWAEAMEREEDDVVAWWSVHGQDEQRFFNTVCLFYGAAPEERSAFATDLGLPEERAETCPEEYDQAIDAWGSVLDTLEARQLDGTFVFDGQDGSLTAQIIEAEVAALNAQFALSAEVTVVIESCGEANAFYDPATREIVMCTEFEDHLRTLESRL